MNLVASNKNVRGVAPFVFGQVLVETEPTNASPGSPARRGCAAWTPSEESSVSVLPKKSSAGKFDLSGRGVIVGSDFAAT